ncbi:Ribonuclease III [Cordyceps fumosorosea ARSEF 2679]|uniref:Ribonuclease III n=1 Tax=Cordyceps fumosorosea (strain ARSEF 2679) TaxID=1081104 RepID=A0A168B4S1_CORFA|nr:Ribonuclease III [Cordyceps fumosorosea ARSEF 2679]OAA69617.1 Ribonuclease III [Cordyceps fumosorosea ARSEF 2679]
MSSSSDRKVDVTPPLNSDDPDSMMEDAPDFSRASRAYQLEMYQMSLKENVIVAMDTGSGKTQIAILRIRAQLESSSDQKLIWFLAPTVLLCTQQFEAIKLEIPSVSIRLVVGSDNVHTWSASTWKYVLNGTQVVVSTYQVLLDALGHAFVKMDCLSLLIFDEGLPQDVNVRSRPAILGLTATPSMRAHVKGLEELEELLNAKCISPSLHREELVKHVKRPRLGIIECESTETEHHTAAMVSLQQEYAKMDILEDPYVVSLQAQKTDRSKRRLQSVLANQKTWSRLQMSSLLNRSRTIRRLLGPWAADLYIWRAKRSFLQKLESAVPSLDGWVPEETLYISRILRDIAALEPTPRPTGLDSVSDKVRLLLRELIEFEGKATGIVFVQERATAAVLTTLLESVPGIRDRYRVGCMVGTSHNQLRKRDLCEYFNSKDLKTLHEFRQGKINLLVATSVLEEGIDVPACNLVICFDSPQSPKSFIQRRGRARMQDSRLLLFTHKGSAIVEQWAVFEEEIQKLCQDSERERQQLQTLERLDEGIDLCFRVPYSGARLDHDNARQHLAHFCAVISSAEYTDGRPDYVTKFVEGDRGLMIRAEVFLPASLPPKLRRFEASRAWHSEANAMKDAAFQAYLALFRADLVNKNLLPLETNIDVEVEGRAPIIGVQSLVQPWMEAASAWSEGDYRWTYKVQLHGADDAFFGDYTMTLPIELGPFRLVNMYLDYSTTYRLEFSPPRRISVAEADEMSDDTSTLIGLHFCHRWPVTEEPHVIKFTSHDGPLRFPDIGSNPLDARSAAVSSENYLIRDQGKAPCRYLGDLPSKPPSAMVQRPFKNYDDAPEDEPYLNLLRWTRRTDFLHTWNVDPETQTTSQKKYIAVLPVSYATVDSIHIKHARFGMLIPSIIHTIETMLIARQLSTTLLSPLGISDYNLIRDAISARSAFEPTHYERLEFLGDSILKYCASMQAAATNLNWSEGHLSRYKDRLVANSRLSRAAVETGLSQFILTMPFTGHKWQAFYLEAVLSGKMKPPPNRRLSTKVLADVVEALVGVAYTVGGIPKAIQCLSIFIKECDWTDPIECREEFFLFAPSHCAKSSYLHILEELVGYSFTKKSLLLEATTHASFIGDMSGRSWERLEFLGDSVLDYIIVNRLINHRPPLPHSRMHMTKTALVNKDFLAFICLEEHELSQTESFVTPSGAILTENRRTALWRFMRFSSTGIGPAQLEVAARHGRLRDAILPALRSGDHYPWAMLARLHAGKFYSDMIEAVVGAIWVDAGALAPCEAFLARVGVLPYLDRVLADGVHMQHPKEELGKVAGSRPMTYEIEKVPAGDGVGMTYNCRLVVSGVEVGAARGGLTAEEVRVAAATEGVAYLKALGGYASRESR